MTKSATQTANKMFVSAAAAAANILNYMKFSLDHAFVYIVHRWYVLVL